METATQAMKLKFGRKINLVKGQYVRLDALPKSHVNQLMRSFMVAEILQK